MIIPKLQLPEIVAIKIMPAQPQRPSVKWVLEDLKTGSDPVDPECPQDSFRHSCHHAMVQEEDHGALFP